MKSELQQLKKRNLYLSYTLLFLLGAGMILAICIYQGRMPIYHADGFRQHVKAMTYYAKYLRGLIYHLVHDHSLSQQAFSFGLGYGSDILTTLQYYCIGDPLALPVIFLPTGWVSYWFMFLIFLRPYLAGLAFIALVSYVRKTRMVSANETSTLVGAVLYSFCGQVLYLAMLHPYFSNPLYIFPLMLLGVEIYLHEHKAAVYTAAVALAAVSNFYYFYMLAVLTALYGIYRVYMVTESETGTTAASVSAGVPSGEQNDELTNQVNNTASIRGSFVKERLLRILKRGLPLIGYAIIGTMTAGAMLIPILVQFRTDPRSETKYAIPLLYSAKYYKQLFKNMISYINHPEYDTEMAFGILAIMCLFMLFARRGHRHLKRAFLVLFVFILVPFFGSFMNDLYFVINRWSWGFDLLIAYIVAMILPEAAELSRLHKAVVTGLTAIYTVLLWQFGFFRFPDEGRAYSAWNVRLSCILMWTVVIVLWLHEAGIALERHHVAVLSKHAASAGASDSAAEPAGLSDGPTAYILPPRAAARHALRLQRVLAWICILSIGVNIYCAYSPLMDDFSREFLEAQKPDEFEATLYSSEATSAADIGGRDGFFRYSGRDLTWNAAMLDGVSSTQFEFSFCNGTITDFFQDIGLVEEQNFAFYGLDDRMIPLMMTGVSLYSIKYDNEFEYQYLPYGFADIGTRNGYHYYWSDLAMPLGFTYSGYITRSAYEELTTNERTEALVYGAMVEDEDAAQLRESEVSPALRSTEIPYEITDVSNLMIEDGRIICDGGGEMTLTFEGLPDCETYIAWDNLSVTGKVANYPIEYVSMIGEDELVEKEMGYCTAESENYSAWSDFTLNVGYDARPRTGIRVSFQQAGVYIFDALRIVCQPLTDIALDAQSLKAEQLVNVDLHKNPISYATDTVTGDITVSTDKLLYLNIPYSTGWTATVDGEKAQIVKANDMYMAIDLAPGEHHIELHYRTPGDTAGYIVSVAGVVLLIAIVVRENRGKRVNG